ncbi:T9SS type A sorting domain-containing protein, partial [Bacteroidota bacterium]
PYPPDFIHDNGDNTVTFNPSILDWTQDEKPKEFTITYNYLNKDSVLLSIMHPLEIEHFDTTRINAVLIPEEACTDDPIIIITGNKPDAIFSGPGVKDLEGQDGEFDYSKADTGLNKIYYTYETPNKCVQQDSVSIMVHETPTPEFEFIDSCILSEGGLISFKNITDTAGLGGNLLWEWNYGDPGSPENRDEFTTMQNGSHRYPGTGRRTITLLAEVSETGCYRSKSITKDFGNTPSVNIDWDTECFTEDPIQFSGSSVSEDGESSFRWRITDMAGSDVKDETGPSLKTLSYLFAERDNYSVEFTAITDKGCLASVTDTIYLRPYIKNITDDAPYMENFEGGAPGWFAFAAENSPQMSWKLASVDAGKFPYNLPDSGSMAWYTEIVIKDTSEQSWISSPCYDFSNLKRPMISLDRKVSSDRDRDGAVIQYTYDDQKSWHNVGAVDDGSINWYNTFRIQNGPGGQGEGWTGGFIFDKSEDWKQSRHDLDDLKGKPRVQFRIAYGSTGSSVVENEGFAFDNIWIGERSRVVLIEQFTNSGMSGSNTANQRINNLVYNNSRDVIDLQYHAEVSGLEDKMNDDNPAPASARSLFYGTRQVPYMVMDGGLSGEMAYDFSENDLDTLDLFTRALVDPFFDIGLVVTEQDNKLNIDLELKALETLPDKEYIVYTVIIEKVINDPAYIGAGSVSVFKNVVRDMVPNAAGISLIQAWNPGDTESIPLSWDISEIILNKEEIYVVVFVQDAENHNVYQVASNDPDLQKDPITNLSTYLQEKDLAMMLYPNPASGEAYLVFTEVLSGKVEIQMFTHTGTLIRNTQLPAGTEMYQMDISGLERGVYFIRAHQKGKLIGVQKLMIMD